MQSFRWPLLAVVVAVLLVPPGCKRRQAPPTTSSTPSVSWEERMVKDGWQKLSTLDSLHDTTWYGLWTLYLTSDGQEIRARNPANGRQTSGRKASTENGRHCWVFNATNLGDNGCRTYWRQNEYLAVVDDAGTIVLSGPVKRGNPDGL